MPPPDVSGATRDELVAILGELSACALRLEKLATLPARARGPLHPGPDALSITEAARRMNMSVSWIYKHADELPFSFRIGRALRFSDTGLACWLVRGVTN